MKQKKYQGIYEYYRKKDSFEVVAYYINIRDEDGKVRKVKTDAKNPDEALLKLNQTKVDVSRNKKSNKKSLSVPTLNEYADIFYNNRADERLLDTKKKESDSSVKVRHLNLEKDLQRYNNHVREIRVGMTKLDRITPAHLKELQETLLQKDEIGNKSINHCLTAVSTILKEASRDSIIHSVPTKPKPLESENERTRVLSDNELDMLFESAKDDRVRLFFRLMYFTAQRPASLLELQKRDVDHNNIYFKAIKRQKAHYIPISAKIREELFDWIKPLDNEDYIFSPTGNSSKALSYERLRDMVSPLFEPLNRHTTDELDRASLYTLRHTALTNIYRNTGDLYLAQKIANHSSPIVTQRYAKTSDSQKMKAIDVL
jgi:integrase